VTSQPLDQHLIETESGKENGGGAKGGPSKRKTSTSRPSHRAAVSLKKGLAALGKTTETNKQEISTTKRVVKKQ